MYFVLFSRTNPTFGGSGPMKVRAAGSDCSLERLYVHPDARRQGIGDALTREVWDEVLSVNLLGTFYCCRAAAPALRQSRGAIVNVASIAGTRASGSSIVYGVSKAAVLQLTRNKVFRSLGPDGVLPESAKGLAWAGLICWLGAITAGRLLAYI